MNIPFEQSFKKRLKTVAMERNLTPSEVWQNVVHERFLVRLCHSPYHHNFILKGGVLLARSMDIGRETKDLDFSVRELQSDVNKLNKVIDKIISINLNDGFNFKHVKIEPLEHFHMEYAGARIKMHACLGKARLPLMIDLGFGDVVKVKKKKIALLANAKGPLFEEKISLHCYPMEFVFAEKLETIVFRGGENSRMKDYHDLFTIAKQKERINKVDTLMAIKNVFNHRRTPLVLPLDFSNSVLQSLQAYWQRYRLMTTFPDRLPIHIKEVVEEINNWISTHHK